jgi:hypothetical protein
MPSLIGAGPGQYLLGCERRRSFDSLKAMLDEELRPADPIERLWVDEFVDLEWDLHRLRTTRRAVVENALATRLTEMAASGHGPGLSPEVYGNIHAAAVGCARGVSAGRAAMDEMIGFFRIEDHLQVALTQTADVLARLEQSIHATSRLRDAILARLYSRRELIADGRVISGRRR